MASAYSIKFERTLGEADVSFRSESLAREVADLNWVATEMGLRPLSEYCSPQFFSAGDGVRTVQTLFREIAAWPPGVKEATDILRDLKEFERILSAAAESGIRFRFQVDVEHEPVAYKLAAPDARIASQLTIEHRRLGVGEPKRSAMR